MSFLLIFPSCHCSDKNQPVSAWRQIQGSLCEGESASDMIQHCCIDVPALLMLCFDVKKFISANDLPQDLKFIPGKDVTLKLRMLFLHLWEMCGTCSAMLLHVSHFSHFYALNTRDALITNTIPVFSKTNSSKYMLLVDVFKPPKW